MVAAVPTCVRGSWVLIFHPWLGGGMAPCPPPLWIRPCSWRVFLTQRKYNVLLSAYSATSTTTRCAVGRPSNIYQAFRRTKKQLFSECQSIIFEHRIVVLASILFELDLLIIICSRVDVLVITNDEIEEVMSGTEISDISWLELQISWTQYGPPKTFSTSDANKCYFVHVKYYFISYRFAIITVKRLEISLFSGGIKRSSNK